MGLDAQRVVTACTVFSNTLSLVDPCLHALSAYLLTDTPACNGHGADWWCYMPCTSWLCCKPSWHAGGDKTEVQAARNTAK